MNRFEFYEGMYCSREFAQWMIRKNEQDTDIPAKSFHKLIRMYCRANYNEFFSEEERKGNDFYYKILREGDRVWLKSTYDLVYLPYEEKIKDFPVDILENVDEFVPGYRILQTRGYMPGSTIRAFDRRDYFSMESLVNHITNGLQDEASDIKRNCTEDVFKAKEFQQAEMKDFIDNDFPSSFGPECPDKIICYQMFNRIVKHLMDEIEQKNIFGDNEQDYQELRLVAYVAAIIGMVLPENYKLSQGLVIEEIKEKADLLFNRYCVNNNEDTLREVCHKISEGRLNDLRVIIDRAAVLQFDYDIYDIDEAPIGLTAEDIKKFEGRE